MRPPGRLPSPHPLLAHVYLHTGTRSRSLNETEQCLSTCNACRTHQRPPNVNVCCPYACMLQTPSSRHLRPDGGAPMPLTYTAAHPLLLAHCVSSLSSFCLAECKVVSAKEGKADTPDTPAVHNAAPPAVSPGAPHALPRAYKRSVTL